MKHFEFSDKALCYKCMPTFTSVKTLDNAGEDDNILFAIDHMNDEEYCSQCRLVIGRYLEFQGL